LIPIHEDEFGANASIRSGFIADPWIICILENGRVVVFEMNAKTKDVDLHSNMGVVEVLLFCVELT
jgi:hypothetical protein